MTNREKYAEELRGLLRVVQNNCGGNSKKFCDFVKKNMIHKHSCDNISCDLCKSVFAIWLGEEYEEPEIDWSKVPIDTKVEVWDEQVKSWLRRYFAGVSEIDNTPMFFSGGMGSFTSNKKVEILSDSCFTKIRLHKEEE